MQTHQQTLPWHWQERQKSQIGSAVLTVASSLHLADHSLQGRGPTIIWHLRRNPVCQLLKTRYQIVLEQGDGICQGDRLILEHTAHASPELIFLQSFRAFGHLQRPFQATRYFPIVSVIWTSSQAVQTILYIELGDSKNNIQHLTGNWIE